MPATPTFEAPPAAPGAAATHPAHPMRLGVCYYPEQWPENRWAADAQAMHALGIRVVRIGEFAWSRIEPEPGRFDWDWLDRAIATLSSAGLQVVLGTPTAAPPAWLSLDSPDLLAVDATGQRRRFGSRRHYCFCSPSLHQATTRVVQAMARRYGHHPAVIAWQVDNEYGCHDTTFSHSPAAVAQFRQWLAERYGDVASLNAAWGTVFWGQQLRSFEEAEPPVGQPGGAYPTHALDWRRFTSDAVLRYHRLQVGILRAEAPGQAVLHNFMGLFTDFDHHAMAPWLDLAAWDNYPLGHTEVAPFLDEAERLQWARTGHPDLPAFHHDLYRGVGGGRLWVMEQQAGPVNWAPWNPLPLPGMVRAWTWEAFAHGAELVAYFRWRQLPFAQEQMHSGLQRPDGHPAPGAAEAAQVARELAAITGDLRTTPARVALVLDYPSLWMAQLQPHGADMAALRLPFAYYSALRQLGLDIDLVGPEADLSGHDLVVLAGVLHLSDALRARLAASPAVVVLGPRTGSKTDTLALPTGPNPAAADATPARRLPGQHQGAESLRPGLRLPLVGLGHAERWRDLLAPEPDAEVLDRFADGWPARLQQGRWQAHAGLMDPITLRAWLGQAARAAGLQTTALADSGSPGLRLRRRGAWQFAFNHGPSPAHVPAPADTSFVLGGPVLAPAGVAAWLAQPSA